MATHVAAEIADRVDRAAAPLWQVSVPVPLPTLQALVKDDKARLLITQEISNAVNTAVSQMRDIFLMRLFTYEIWLWQVGADSPPKDVA